MLFSSDKKLTGNGNHGKQLVCPCCGGTNIQVEFVEKGAKTNKHGNGIMGHVNNAARDITALSTMGLSNLVWKKSKGNNTTKIQNQKVAICQN